MQKQAIAKDKRDQATFDALKKRAGEIREEKFKNVSAEEYGAVYETLDANIKPFFATGQQVLQQKADSILDTRSQVKDRMDYAREKLAERKAYWEKKISDREASWQSKSSSYRNRENRDGERYRKIRHKERINDYEDDLDEDVAKWQGYIKGLQKGSRPLDQNKNITYQSIENYADDVASFEENKEEARNDNRNNYNKQKAQGKLDETFKQLGLEKGKTSYGEFKREVKDYNKGVAVQQNLIDYANRVGFDKLTPQQKNKVNPDLAQWQWENPNEKLIFKGINPVGFESGALKQSISLDNYKRVTSPEYIYDQWKQKNPAPKVAPVYDFKSGGFQSVDPNPFSNIKKSTTPQFKTLTAGRELPIGFGSQGTSQVNSQGDFVTPTAIIKTQDYYKIKNDPSTPIGDLWGGVKTGFKYVDERFHFTGDISKPLSFGKIKKIPRPEQVVVSADNPFLNLGESNPLVDNLLQSKVVKVKDTRTFEQKYGMTKPEMAVDLGISKLKDKKQDIEEWVIGKKNIDKFNADIEAKFENRYQYQFEQKHMKDLIFGEIDFATASSEFKESAEAKRLQKQFEREYGSGYKDLQTVTNNPLKEDFWRGRVVGGVANTGLGLGQLGLGIVKTPTRVAGAGAVVYTGGAVLGAIPTAVSLGISGSLFGYGAYKFLDPSSTYLEAGGGLVTSAIAGATLTYAGVKYLKSPVVKRVAIKPPKATLKTAGGTTIGKDVHVIKDSVTQANKVVYRSQKLSQVGKAGSRTIVTTKGRVLANKFWKEIGVPAKHTTLDSNAIYRGVPTQQLGKAYTVQSLRGSTKVVIGKSGYQKAFDKLSKYGWSDAQAKATLRYTAPKVFESYSKGFLQVTKTGKATGIFEQTIKRPVYDVSKSLGIKTRGGADLKDITKVTRQLTKDATGKIFAREQGLRVGGFVDKSGNIKDWRDLEIFSGKTFVKATNQKGFEYLGKQSGVDVWKADAKYKDLWSVSKQDALKIKLSKTSKNYGLDIDYNPARQITIKNAKLYKQIIDLDKGKNVWVKPTNIKKTPFAKTFGSDPTDDLFSFSKETKTSDAVKKVMDKIDDISGGSGASSQIKHQIKEQSKYFGTGQYEQSFGGALSPKELLQNQNLLKSPLNAQAIKVGSGIKGAILMKELELGNVLAVGNVASLTSGLGLKNAPQLKVNLKANNQLKELLRTDALVKTAQVPAIKTSTALKSQLKSILDLDLGSPLANNPVFKTPSIPKIRQPTIPNPFVIPFLKAKIKKGSKGKGSKKITDLAYLPDFTSRALGLNPQVISQKQANAKLKKLLTGLEIRRGVKIK